MVNTSDFAWMTYIWLDGNDVPGLRAKTDFPGAFISPKERDDYSGMKTGDRRFPVGDWGFDGSSTVQAKTGDSDRLLRPVKVVEDPLRDDGRSYLVMSEVLYPDGRPHESNNRHKLLDLVESAGDQDPWFSVELEYTLEDRWGNKPFGWPEHGKPEIQGNHYCGVGSPRFYGDQISKEHAEACLKAGLPISGINNEVMPGQFEFQMGRPGSSETAGPLVVADSLWLAKYLLQEIAGAHGASVSFDPKPRKGDWNGAGAHTNFSTIPMRVDGGIDVIREVCDNGLKDRHEELLAVYGSGNEWRLTGQHETAHIKEYRWGFGDRGASVRVNSKVEIDGKGYLEDRRPAANMDPYRAFEGLLRAVGFSSEKARA